MEKEFVSYEQALALKELGFDEYVIAYWEKNSLLKPIPMSDAINSFPVNDYPKADWIAAPLKQQVFRWFREKYGLYQQIEVFRLSEFKDDKLLFDFKIIDNLDDTDFYYDNEFMTTYEEAENALIDKLIELAKQQDNGK
jgi:hypothetical protein